MIQKCLDAFCLSLSSLSGYLVTFSNLMALNLKKEGLILWFSMGDDFAPQPPPPDIGQHVETFLIVRNGYKGLLTSVQARDAASILEGTRGPP